MVDYIERVLDIVTINRTETNNVDDGVNHQVFNQDTYPFRICDIHLTMVSSVYYVYILVSLRHPNYTYIGTAKCIRTKLQMHNSARERSDWYSSIIPSTSHLHYWHIFADSQVID